MDEFQQVELIVVVAIFGIAMTSGVGAILGTQFRAQPLLGALCGLLCGLFGWVLVFALPDNRRRCEQCRGLLMAGASRCSHCGQPTAKVA